MDHRTPNPDRGQMRDTSKRFGYLVAGLVLMAVVGFFARSVIYRGIKSHRAVLRAREAERLMKENNWGEAARMIKAAVDLAQAEPEVLRAAGHFSAKTGLREGLATWKILLDLPEATWQDRLDYLGMALNLKRLDLSRPEVAAILATNTTDPEVLQLAALHYSLDNKPQEAIQLARKWAYLQATNLEVELLLGRLLAASNERGERAEGRRLLMSLAVGKGKVRDQAVDYLARSPDLTPAEGLLLLKALAERPNAELARAYLEIKLRPDRRQEIVGAVLQRARGATNDQELHRYAVWLREQGENRQLPELLPEDRVRTNPALLTDRLEALIETGRLNEAVPYLKMANPPVEPHVLHCLRALAAQRTGQSLLVNTHFDSALAAAGNDTNKLIFIAHFAEHGGVPLAAIAAYQRLLQYPAMANGASRQIIRLVGPMDDLSSTRDILRKLSELLPADDALFLDSAYAGFLVGESQPEIRSELARRAQRSPKQQFYQIVQALGELRAGNQAEALQLIEGLHCDWDKAESRWLAVYAAVLGANQQREAARLMAAKVKLASLKQQELELVKPWRSL